MICEYTASAGWTQGIEMLTPRAAADLGRSLRFLRHAQDMTLREVAKRAGLSPQYIQNIERGERVGTSSESFEKLARGYGVDFAVVADLLLKARVMSNLELRGIGAEQSAFVWRGVEQRLQEQGVELSTDVSRVVSRLMEG